jgi:hypothetical protein
MHSANRIAHQSPRRHPTLRVACSACAGIAPRNIRASTRRSRATLHDKISNQIRNLKMRAKKFIDSSS